MSGFDHKLNAANEANPSERLTKPSQSLSQRLGQTKLGQKIQAHKAWIGLSFWWLVLVIFVLCLAALLNKHAPNAVQLDSEQLSAIQSQQIHQSLLAFDNRHFYQADIDKLAQSLMALSWVESVQIRRDWQKGVMVQVRPKTAVANFGSNHLLDVHGTVFRPADMQELTQIQRIQLYSVPSATQTAMDKVQKLNLWFAPLGIVVEDMILTPRQTWLVRFNSGLRITVDYDNVDEKLFHLSRLLIEKRLNMPLDDIAAIDLRYKNGFSLIKKPKHNGDGQA